MRNRSRILNLSIGAMVLLAVGGPLLACFSGTGDHGETYDGQPLTPSIAQDLADAASDLGNLSAACKQAVQAFSDALANGDVCEEHGTAFLENLATTKTSTKQVNVAPDVLAGISPEMSLWGLVSHEGTHLNGGDGCQALQCEADAACDRLQNDPNLTDAERSQLCAEIQDVLNKASAEGCTIQNPCSCTGDPEGDPVPPPLGGISVPVPPTYDPHWAQVRSYERDLSGNVTDAVVYQTITASKSLHVLFWIGNLSIRRVLNLRMFPLSLAVDDRDPSNPVVFVAGVDANGTPLLKKVVFTDAKNNRFSASTTTTLFTSSVGYVSDMAFDATNEDLYLLDDENDKIWVYATVGTPTLMKFVAASDPGFSGLATMRTLLAIEPSGVLKFYVDENWPRQTQLAGTMQMCVLWDSDGDGKADQQTCGTTDQMTF